MRYLAVLLLLTAGCSQRMEARQSMRESHAAYKQCLAQNPPAGCETQRQAYEADAKAVEALGSSRPGFMYVVPTR